jgi:hypothetical protein
MNKRGRNAIKGKQGFQPVRNGPPRALHGLPLSDSSLEFDVAQQQFQNRQLYLARTNTPRGYVDNYTWENAILSDIRNEHGRPGHLPEKLAEKIGSPLVLAAYGKEVDRLKDSGEKASPKHLYLAKDIARVVSNDSSRSYSAPAFAAAARLNQLDDDQEALAKEILDDESGSGLSPLGESLLAVASEQRNGNSHYDAETVEKYSREAEYHRAALSGSSDAVTYRGKAFSRAPSPSRELVEARATLIRKEWEKRSQGRIKPLNMFRDRSRRLENQKTEKELQELRKTVERLEQKY